MRFARVLSSGARMATARAVVLPPRARVVRLTRVASTAAGSPGTILGASGLPISSGAAPGGSAARGPGAPGVGAAGGGGRGGGGSDLVFDVTEADFQTRVLASPVPIILDLHAHWCKPCKSLTPKLEQIVASAGGNIKLAKLDIDANPRLAEALKVSSVPTVFAIVGGRVVDNFTGDVPPQRLQQMVSRISDVAAKAGAGGGAAGGAGAPKPPTLLQALDVAYQVLEEAMVSVTGKKEGAKGPWAKGASEEIQANVSEASQLFASLISQAVMARQRPGSVPGVDLAPEELELLAARAAAGFLTTLMAAGQTEVVARQGDEFRKILEAGKADPRVQAALAAIEAADAALEAERELAALEDEVSKDPTNLEAQYKLAEGQNKAGQPEKAIDTLLDMMRANRSWNEEAAKKMLLRIFGELGTTHPAVVRGRKRMSAILFV